MREPEKYAGGMWCSEVLARLSEYVDRELSAADAAKIEAHLAACDWCERFGTQFSAVLQQLVSQLAAPEPLDEARSARLHARLRTALERP